MAITTTVDSLGQLLKVWRDSSGLTLKQLAAKATKVLPGSKRVSYGTLHRYEGDIFPDEGPDPLVLAAVAIVCERKLADYPDEIRSLMAASDELLRMPCFRADKLAAA